MAWETQGPVTDRARENLGTTDTGIALYRRLLREQIQHVQNGEDPKGLIRDAALNDVIRIEVSTGQRRMAREIAKA
jgi:5,5'-dehydrodivanillate O-demethylase